MLGLLRNQGPVFVISAGFIGLLAAGLSLYFRFGRQVKLFNRKTKISWSETSLFGQPLATKKVILQDP